MRNEVKVVNKQGDNGGSAKLHKAEWTEIFVPYCWSLLF